jgi:hypothetical protein
LWIREWFLQAIKLIKGREQRYFIFTIVNKDKIESLESIDFTGISEGSIFNCYFIIE